MPTADEYTTNIQNALKAGANYLVISTVRTGEKDKIYGWLNLDRDTPGLKDDGAFESLCKSVWDYEVEYFYEEKELKDRLGSRTLSSSDAVAGLNKSGFDQIVAALEKLAQGLEGSEKGRIEDVAKQLEDEFRVLSSTVQREIDESHEKMEVGHYNVATGSGASAAPSSHQPDGEGHREVKQFEFTDTNSNKAKWTFGLRCVNDAEDAYVLPDTESKDPWHWRLDKDEPIVVEVEGAEQPKTTKAKENFAPNKDKIKEPDDGLKQKFVEGILEKWPVKDNKWYPLAGPDAEATLPDSHKIAVSEKEKDGYVWTFNMAWVDQDEEMYLKKDDAKAHHLVVAKGQKVVVGVKGDDDLTKETQISEALALPDDAGEDGDKAIEELLKNGGADKWYPREPTTDSEPPSTHKIHVVAREREEHRWSFAVAWVDADEKVFLKKASARADHPVIAKGERIVVARIDGRGEPKETVITQQITVEGGGTDDDAVADKAIDLLLEEDGAKWFPASLEDQAAAKEEEQARQRSADLGKDVTAKGNALQQAAARMPAFVRAHLSTAARRQKPVVPAEKIQGEFADWGKFAEHLKDAIQLGPEHDSGVDEMRDCVREGLALVTEAEDLGGSAPQLENIAQLCRDLNDALNTYASA